jgi:hypothetical protein
MATVSFVTPEELAALKQEVDELRALIQAYMTTQEDWLPTDVALRTSGIKARSTLVMYKRASGPDKQEEGRITYKKQGTKCLYLRASCIDYARRKMGLVTLNK